MRPTYRPLNGRQAPHAAGALRLHPSTLVWGAAAAAVLYLGASLVLAPAARQRPDSGKAAIDPRDQATTSPRAAVSAERAARGAFTPATWTTTTATTTTTSATTTTASTTTTSATTTTATTTTTSATSTTGTTTTATGTTIATTTTTTATTTTTTGTSTTGTITTATTTTPSAELEEREESGRSSGAGGWLEPPAGCCDDGRPAIATYAGKDKLSYIDGAVMLGLSLRQHAPEFPRLCLVIKTMAQENKDLLAAAGWALIETEEWHPHQEHFAHDYWWMVYNKIDVFRVRAGKLLWMDSDMYVWGGSLREVLESTELPEGHIAMVKDRTGENFNSGLMLFRPSLEVYEHIRKAMVENSGWDGLDQPLINQEYSGKIVELPAKFNAHGTAKSCEGVVVAHYTGHDKPTLASAWNLRRVSRGFRNVPYSLRCPHLYERMFCEMESAGSYLSQQLQAALQDVDNEQLCLA